MNTNRLSAADVAHCIPHKFVAVCPKTGIHLREATAEETAAYFAQPVRFPGKPDVFNAAFLKAHRVGDVLVDMDTGPGGWHGGAGF
jgi:hypothetical protein